MTMKLNGEPIRDAKTKFISYFYVLLMTLLVCAKLDNIIEWPWMCVMAGFWIPFAVIVILLGLGIALQWIGNSMMKLSLKFGKNKKL